MVWYFLAKTLAAYPLLAPWCKLLTFSMRYVNYLCCMPAFYKLFLWWKSHFGHLARIFVWRNEWMDVKLYVHWEVSWLLSFICCFHPSSHSSMCTARAPWALCLYGQLYFVVLWILCLSWYLFSFIVVQHFLTYQVALYPSVTEAIVFYGN